MDKVSFRKQRNEYYLQQHINRLQELGITEEEYKKNKIKKREKDRQRITGFRDKRLQQQTVAERAFTRILKELGIEFKQEKIMKVGKGKHRLIDFYLKDFNTGVEVDGGYHFTAEQFLKDHERTIQLKRKVRKYKTEIRFTNEEILYGERIDIVKKLIVGILPFSLKYLK